MTTSIVNDGVLVVEIAYIDHTSGDKVDLLNCILASRLIVRYPKSPVVLEKREGEISLRVSSSYIGTILS